MNAQIIAFYLPQYHRIPENDLWWGEGFTDWVNVKKAGPLYPGHNQPRIPYNRNYYDLSDAEDILSQVQLAKEYGVYGFCFYHYWFNEHLLLEKPAEIFLENTDWDLPFCFCWANETWARTWDGKNKDILISQEYGGKDAWISHFDYLYQFLIDDRYIKIDGHPVLVIYNTKTIPRLAEMKAIWDEECIKRGIKPLYIISENNGFQDNYSDGVSEACLYFEPMYTIQNDRSFLEKTIQRLSSDIKRMKRRTKARFFDYDILWNKITSRDYENAGQKVFLGGFVDWDNTPRKGERGIVVEGANPDKFRKYLKKQIELSQKLGSEYIFINAWNEWAEGSYLEPDEANGTEYLGVIKELMNENQNRDVDVI